MSVACYHSSNALLYGCAVSLSQGIARETAARA
jgi:hypothetical protein